MGSYSSVKSPLAICIRTEHAGGTRENLHQVPQPCCFIQVGLTIENRAAGVPHECWNIQDRPRGGWVVWLMCPLGTLEDG
jgi:hypothetical protein